MLKEFEQLDSDNKVLFLLSLTDLIINNLSESEGFEVAKSSIKKCWDWLEKKEINAFDLYMYLENMDEIDVLSYMSLEQDSEKIKYWSCVGNALAYTIREAYEYEKEKYLPQTIESVDFDTIEDFIKNYNEIDNKPALINKLITHLSTMSDLNILDRITATKLFLEVNFKS
ncbi:MAG: immunity 6 family protein [Hungatella sp.]|jgi:hypothetical protein|nr:immunity 6 family protein [Hungatella sp.]